jgi:hypothetical protein
MVDQMIHVGMMLGAHAAMSDNERAELAAWEREHITGDGKLATSDWPGWRAYLPDRPVAPSRETFVKRPIPAGLRTRVFERDAYRCKRCGAYRNLTADHVIPESKGGPTALDNLQTLCRSCNSRKGTRQD